MATHFGARARGGGGARDEKVVKQPPRRVRTERAARVFACQARRVCGVSRLLRFGRPRRRWLNCVSRLWTKWVVVAKLDGEVARLTLRLAGFEVQAMYSIRRVAGAEIEGERFVIPPARARSDRRQRDTLLGDDASRPSDGSCPSSGSRSSPWIRSAAIESSSSSCAAAPDRGRPTTRGDRCTRTIFARGPRPGVPPACISSSKRWSRPWLRRVTHSGCGNAGSTARHCLPVCG
jgi:hypothetical protein